MLRDTGRALRITGFDCVNDMLVPRAIVRALPTVAQRWALVFPG